MTLKVPNLDDRSFDDLRREALAVIAERAPQWTDRSPSDPGITLLELFAHLTEVLIYRVNRMPEKAHLTLLNLLGVGPRAPAAAEVGLTFRRSPSGSADRDLPALQIPAGTVVTDRSGTISFFTLADTELPALPGGTAPETAPTASAIAVNAERVEGELLGTSTGQAGQSFTVRRGPILRRPNDPNGLIVGVQSAAGPGAGSDSLAVDGKPFSIWREVEAFSGVGPDDPVYVVDRASGMITFGTGAAGAAPPAGSEVRAWYRRGGGRAGNVAPDVLTNLKRPIPGVEVSNSDRASGGEDMESLDDAMLRGREAVRVLRSAVTARDFENVAAEVPGIARARAYAQRDVWYFGRPGTVDVLVVPSIDVSTQPEGITAEVLAAHQTPRLLANTREHVRQHRPVGVESRVDWARCRPVSVSARVVLSSVENEELVATRLKRRLHALLAPDGSWPFGRPLRVSDVYEAMLSEPGFRYAEDLVLSIADAPEVSVRDIHRDQSQPGTFYVAGRELYRSQDNGGSWSSILQRAGETFLGVRTSAIVPGLVAAFTRPASGDDSTAVVYVSEDGGESWDDRRRPQGTDPADRMLQFRFPFEVRDVAWSKQNDMPVLLVVGRSAVQVIRFSSPVVVEGLAVRGESQAGQADDARGFEAVATTRHVSGLLFTAVAAREQLGVYLSAGNGPFRLLPDTTSQPIRTLGFQQIGNETFLWAGLAADKGETGKGAMRIGVRVDGWVDPTGWEAFSANWSGGSCEAIDFFGDTVAVGTNRAGVLLWTLGADKAWSASPAIDCGLPLIDERRAIQPIFGAALGRAGSDLMLLAGGDGGTYISFDRGRSYEPNGRSRFEDRVPLPRNWLFCSGRIDLDVKAEAAEG